MNNPFRVQSSKFKVQSSRFEPGTRNPERGTRNPEHGAATWALSAVLALMPAIAAAQLLKDPMRPPAGYAEGDPEAAAVVGGPVLQSVMISPTRRAAIINGEVVQLGGRYGNAVLIKVAEHEVMLQSGDETQVLKMHPGVEKRGIAPGRNPARGGGAEDAAKGDTAPR
jgi:MSHA biogenesis protein MshK